MCIYTVQYVYSDGACTSLNDKALIHVLGMFAKRQYSCSFVCYCFVAAIEPLFFSSFAFSTKAKTLKENRIDEGIAVVMLPQWLEDLGFHTALHHCRVGQWINDLLFSSIDH